MGAAGRPSGRRDGRPLACARSERWSQKHSTAMPWSGPPRRPGAVQAQQFLEAADGARITSAGSRMMSEGDINRVYLYTYGKQLAKSQVTRSVIGSRG
jgi:hypothetical protein